VVLSTLVGYGLWNQLIMKHGASRIAPFSLLVPLFGVASAALVLGERFTRADALAAVLIIGGLLLHVVGARQGKAAPKAAAGEGSGKG
jgi:O-acetylserine/cysteine efflux transporter